MRSRTGRRYCVVLRFHVGTLAIERLRGIEEVSCREAPGVPRSACSLVGLSAVSTPWRLIDGLMYRMGSVL